VTAIVPSGFDLDGRPVKLLSSGAAAVVLFFTATDCPISRRYEPEMLRLEAEFAAAHVEFWWVYPNPGDSAAVIRRHRESATGSAHVLRDPDQSLTRWAGATITPEAVVFVPERGTLRKVYLGRIDDRYLSFGRERPQAMHRELESAIAALLAKMPVIPPGGPPVGCYIVPAGMASR
jgi:hypothetical protein